MLKHLYPTRARVSFSVRNIFVSAIISWLRLATTSACSDVFVKELFCFSFGSFTQYDLFYLQTCLDLSIHEMRASHMFLQFCLGNKVTLLLWSANTFAFLHMHVCESLFWVTSSNGGICFDSITRKHFHCWKIQNIDF